MSKLIIPLAILFAASVALADDLPPEIAAGIAAYDDLEYEQAIAKLRPALGRKSLPNKARLAGYRVLGLSLVALGRTNEARDAFRQLLEIDRSFELGESENPVARRLLQEVRLDLPAEVGLEHSASPTPGRADSPLAIAIQVSDESRVVSGITVHYRVRGANSYGTVQATALGGGGYNATIPGTFVTEPAIEYYVVARGADGRQVAIASSAAAPTRIAIEKRATGESGSVLSSPLFWLGTGTVVAAGAIAAIFLLRPSDDGPAETGQVQVEVVW